MEITLTDQSVKWWTAAMAVVATVAIAGAIAGSASAATLSLRGAPAAHGRQVVLRARCRGPRGTRCRLTATLVASVTVHPHTRRAQVVTFVAGRRTTTVRSGRTAVVRVSLNARGRALLVDRHRLQVGLLVTSSAHRTSLIVAKRVLTIRETRRRRHRRG